MVAFRFENNSTHHSRIVKRLVEKYDGYITYSVEDNVFIAEVMISMTTAVNSAEKEGKA